MAALAALMRSAQPKYVLFPHTYQVRDFAPTLATRFGPVLVPDVIEIRTDGSRPVFVRQLFQGKLNADVEFSGGARTLFRCRRARIGRISFGGGTAVGGDR